MAILSKNFSCNKKEPLHNNNNKKKCSKNAVQKQLQFGREFGNSYEDKTIAKILFHPNNIISKVKTFSRSTAWTSGYCYRKIY
jgi:hypothetical protein